VVSDLLGKIRRGLRKPPGYVAARAWHEFTSRLEKYRGPARARALTTEALLRLSGQPSIDALWGCLAGSVAPTAMDVSRAALDRLAPGEADRLVALADRAMRHEVDLLGSGPVQLGREIDWHRDFKSGLRFEPRFCKDIAYNDLDKPNDVKVPWELSRMQWLLPAGQAYRLDRDERYAEGTRAILESWLDSNPYACSVNWACTMDVALRGITWIWLFFAFADSEAWRDPAFRGRLLTALYLHGDFVSRHLEKADINGNHYTADAAGLVFIGEFFGETGKGAAWGEQGWQILSSEITRQVFLDGVDFEASVPYHRLVQELFLYPALYRQRLGKAVAEPYRDRLRAMARFTEAYSRVDGSVPLWGDADDARTMPFRHDAINDHRYLVGVAGLALGDVDLLGGFSGPRQEIAWLLGMEMAERLGEVRSATPVSTAFPDGGFYVLRDARNHVFVDCGPLGLAGRGGHGHNDLLAFEAMLDGVHLVSDSGAYLYTADYRQRNAFRSTAYHNTPQIDDEEIYRFVRPDYLWVLHNDARADAGAFEAGTEVSSFEGSHTGYLKLADPVTVHRAFTLDHGRNALSIGHRFEGKAPHRVAVPFQFAPGVAAEILAPNQVLLTAGAKRFALSWSEEGWVPHLEQGRVSPSYGVAVPATRLVLAREGILAGLTVTIA